MKATRDLERDSEEVDMANVCFIANENTPKITSESSLEECELFIDKLGKAFEELSNNYDFLKKKYLKMKKENELQNKLVVIFKEKILSSTFEKTQKNFDAHKSSCKAKFLLLMKMRFLF